MKRVTYFHTGGMVILKTEGDVFLSFGEYRSRDLRWAVTEDVFENMKRQNSNVEFVEDSKRGRPRQSTVVPPSPYSFEETVSRLLKVKPAPKAEPIRKKRPQRG